MYAAQFFVRIVQQRQKRLYVLEAELYAEALQAEKVRD